MTSKIDNRKIVDFIVRRAQSSDYRDFMVKLLCDLVDINTTTTGQPLSDIVSNERKAFDLLENTIRSFAGPDLTLERDPIDPDISDHPYYTRTYYTANEENPQGLSPEESYQDRFNLLARVNPTLRSTGGRPVLLNAHIDTVSPYYPHRTDDQFIHGRGSCDDKGSVVALVACMKLWHEIQREFGPIPSQPHVYQFVIEEEPGGNGSLSIVLGKRFRGYQAIICECTSNTPFPANRGAMWFQMDLDTSAGGFNTAQIVPFILFELAKEGQQLRAETNQPLFPREYVQVNLGSLNSFGKHPATVNDYVAYEFTVSNPGMSHEKLTSQLNGIIDSAIAYYTQSYADRTRELHPETKQPKLRKHYLLTDVSGEGGKFRYELEIFGIGGHMGAMLQCDNALIKTGYIMQALVRTLLAQPGVDVEFHLAEPQTDTTRLTLMGGVGFTPSHRMADLQSRLREAAHRGIKRYNENARTTIPVQSAKMTFDKLHNEAYASPTDGPGMRAFHSAFESLDIPWPKPKAWRASCDARIFGNNGYNTVTFGPGDLADAHGDHEKIQIPELQKGLQILLLTLLNLTDGE